jgi:hypothetical protein
MEFDYNESKQCVPRSDAPRGEAGRVRRQRGAEGADVGRAEGVAEARREVRVVVLFEAVDRDLLAPAPATSRNGVRR